MKLTKYSRPIPNRKQFNEPANGPVIRSYMDPAEMILKYGPPNCKWKRGLRA